MTCTLLPPHIAGQTSYVAGVAAANCAGSYVFGASTGDGQLTTKPSEWVSGVPVKRPTVPASTAAMISASLLRTVAATAARTAGWSKGTYLAAQYHRLAARRGTKRAAVAVGHTILVIVYRLLSEGDVYWDLGERYCDERDRKAVERRLVARLEGHGSTVSLDPAA